MQGVRRSRSRSAGRGSPMTAGPAGALFLSKIEEGKRINGRVCCASSPTGHMKRVLDLLAAGLADVGE